MRTVCGFFDSDDEASAAIHRLRDAGIADDRIGVAKRDSADLATATDAEDMSEEGATAGAVGGAGVGALVGLALVGSSFVLPGVGAFLIGGPIAAALTGAGIGAASGGLIGGLVGAGIPEDEARDYAGRLERGEVLVSVGSEDSEVATVRQILHEEGSLDTPLPPRPQA